MAKSKGMAMARGYSAGAHGHGGVHAKGGSVTAHGSNSPKMDHLRNMHARGDAEMNGHNPAGMFGPQVQ